MKNIRNIATIIATITAFCVSCNKDEHSTQITSDLDGIKGDKTEEFHIGRKLNNPYTVENMRRAQDSLLRIGQLKDPIDIHPTHLYVQMYPSDSADLNKILEDTALHLFPYPLDYEIEGEGSFEVNEGDTPEVYTVVPVGYDIPIKHRVIDECYIPTNYDDPSTVTLEIGSLIRTGNMTDEEMKDLFSTKALLKYPKGHVRVWNTESSQNEGVRKVRVYTRKIVKIASAYTNDNGYYSISRGYLCNPHYAVVFENKTGFKIWGNIGPFTPAIHNVGKHSRNGYDITIGRNSQAWPWATINNAALLYRTVFAPHFGVTNTPGNLRFWYIDRHSSLGSASAPMLRQVSGYTSSQVTKWLRAFGVSTTTSYFVGGILWCAMQLCPDILVMNNSSTSTRDLQATIFHEMSHASHYSKVGSAYWLNYIGQICLNMGYGNSYNGTNGIIGVGEMWGDYFGKKCLNFHYGTNSSCTNSHWFKPQILADIDNQLPDVGPAQIHSVMGTSVTNPSNFKSALISQWGHSEVITQCFGNHGF